MEKILAYFKNKSVGYFIVAGIALLALIVSVIFFATYRNPDLATQMGNKAEGFVVETIGIFLLAGAVIEIVVLVIPQYRFIQIAAIAMFGLAMYKDVILIPDFIVGKINNVEYNGGNFPLNMFFFVMIFLIVIASIVAAFLGFYTKEEEAQADMKNLKGTVNLAKLGAGAAVVLAAILVSSLVSNNLVNKTSKSNKGGAESQQTSTSEEEIPQYDPITDEIREAADAYDYSFDPLSVIMKEQEEYDFSAVSSIPTNGSRSGHNLVYYFEGSYSEGWQGDYSETYGAFYLWDDGMFGAVADGTNIRGYWYNSSLVNGTDEDGNDIRDCLNMVSNQNNYKSIITEPATGFYHYQAYIYISKNGGRSMIINGYDYYPEVALAIDATSTGLEYKVGDKFDRSSWVANRILKNLSYSAVYKPGEVTWSDQQGMHDSNGKLLTAGEYTVTAKWNGLEASVTVTVTDPAAEEQPADSEEPQTPEA